MDRCHQGIICPAEMWHQVADRLTTRNVATVLDGLPVDLQHVLRRAYAERPWSLRSDARDNEVRLEVERWCGRCDPESFFYCREFTSGRLLSDNV